MAGDRRLDVALPPLQLLCPLLPLGQPRLQGLAFGAQSGDPFEVTDDQLRQVALATVSLASQRLNAGLERLDSVLQVLPASAAIVAHA